MIRNKIYLIPNLLTTGSVLCGFLSIIYSFDNNIQIAANLIFASFVLDGLDGRVARITKTTSEFGAQYDSLADVISFGIAPAIILYQWFLKDINFFINSWLELGLIISSLYLVSVLLRLARFNSTKSGDFFIGLPCPLAAILVCLSYTVLSKTNIEMLFYKEISAFLVLVVSFLMISKFSYFSFKNIGDSEKIKFYWLLFIIFVLFITLINPPMVLLLLAIIYSLSGLVLNFYRQYKKGKIIVCGNGGSSSIASHVAVDISKILRIKAITFADDNLITCFANDYGYDKWTSEALKIYSNINDLVILISSSGSSKNIVNAAKFAKKQGNPLITLSGFKENNPLKKIGDVNIWMNSNSYNHIEMAHHIFLVAVIDCLKK